MRWAFYATITTLSVVIGYDRFTDIAFAVMGGKSPQPVAPLEERAAVRLDVPVAWQLTRSKLLGPGATTLTESFRETWTVELTASGRLYLESPRARVAAYSPQISGAPVVIGKDQAPGLPRSIVLSERDLGRLVGLRPNVETPEDETDALAEPVGRPVTLTLLQSGKSGLDVSLAWSEEEHYAVHLDVGSSTVF